MRGKGRLLCLLLVISGFFCLVPVVPEQMEEVQGYWMEAEGTVTEFVVDAGGREFIRIKKLTPVRPPVSGEGDVSPDVPIRGAARGGEVFSIHPAPADRSEMILWAETTVPDFTVFVGSVTLLCGLVMFLLASAYYVKHIFFSHPLIPDDHLPVTNKQLDIECKRLDQMLKEFQLESREHRQDLQKQINLERDYAHSSVHQMQNDLQIPMNKISLLEVKIQDSILGGLERLEKSNLDTMARLEKSNIRTSRALSRLGKRVSQLIGRIDRYEVKEQKEESP